VYVKGTKALALRSPISTTLFRRARRVRRLRALGVNLVGTDIDLENLGAKKERRGGKDKSVKENKRTASPAWAPALQQIYGSVLDESLPKEIQDLLNKLDSKS
jgi:hypothetical protein